MGEAKRRGTADERKAEAIARDEAANEASRVRMEAEGVIPKRGEYQRSGRRLGAGAMAALLAMSAMGNTGGSK